MLWQLTALNSEHGRLGCAMLCFSGLIMFLVPLLLGMPTTILDIRRTLGQDGRVRVQSSGRSDAGEASLAIDLMI